MFKSIKEIHKLDLAITTRCNFRCRYCFVCKTNETMDLKTAKNAARLLLSSPGRVKKLIIYGGEPLLHPSLLKKLILFIEEISRISNKRILVSLGTNGVLLNTEFANFLNEHAIKVCISMDGLKRAHDANRLFKNGKPSFARLHAALPLMLRTLKDENVAALVGVHPRFASELFAHFQFVTKRGISNINIEPIQNVSWSEDDKKAFLANLTKIAKHILANINKDNFIFLNSVNKRIAGENLHHPCPFYDNIELYPSGDMTFSGFLMNSDHKKNYTVGRMDRGFFGEYASCVYRRNKRECRICRKKYFNVPIPDSDMYKLRNSISQRLAEYITDSSRHNSRYAAYMAAAKRRIFE